MFVPGRSVNELYPLRGVVWLQRSHDAVHELDLRRPLLRLVEEARLVQVPLAFVRPVLALEGEAALWGGLELKRQNAL